MKEDNNMTGCPIPEPDDDSVFLGANEKLLAAKAYLLFTVNENGYSSFVDMRNLNDLELRGFIKIAMDKLNELDYLNSEENEEDSEGE
jgi:hypothetical protein